MGIRTPGFSKAHIKALEHYSWPGNVREVQNVIERAVILAAHGEFTIQLDSTPRRADPPRTIALPLNAVKDQVKELIIEAMKESRGKIYGSNGAAAFLGLKPTTLASKLQKFGLNREDFVHGGTRLPVGGE
jgi:DNA-binding NtrC family response regulator